MQSFLLILLIILSIAALWFVAANYATDLFMRRRQADPVDLPSNYGIDYEEVEFLSRDSTKLAGWWIPASSSVGSALGTIIICHGQNGSMDGDTKQMVPLHDAGFNVFMFDFRAHGRSDGTYVTMGMFEKEDLLGAIDYLGIQRHVDKVGVLGFSMGAATALITAALSECIAAVVADSSFGRLKWTLAAEMRKRWIPGFIARLFANSIVTIASLRTEGRVDHTDPIRWTVHIGPRPILFIHGEDDRLVSMRDLDRMASLAIGPVEVWIAEDVGHRGAYKAYPHEYNQRIVEFFKKYIVNQGQSQPSSTALTQLHPNQNSVIAPSSLGG